MKIIERVRIKYFRSILHTTRGNKTSLNTNHLNVIVGCNDVGKSNYLKALNLFFNGTTDPNTVFNFWNEFSRQRHGVRKEENRIEIELVINPPSNQNFRNSGKIIWTKKWTPSSNIPEETFKYLEKDDEFKADGRSTYYKWLKKIRFRYVPAIKSKKYFNDLMFIIYDVFQKETAQIEKNFNEQMREKTATISDEITKRLNIDSILQFRGSFRDLFLNLEFGSEDGSSFLSQRGDGIKVRHIPIILQNIAEAELKENRKPIASTIWGFEEPENNLEFDSARKLAESFLEYIGNIHFGNESFSKYDEGIQIFITTHSPVFYTLSKLNNDNVSTFLVKKNNDDSSKIMHIERNDSTLIENEMKLFPLVELSSDWIGINEKLKNLEQSKNELEKKLANNDYTVDKKYLFLTEDNDKSYINILLEANGFDLKELDIESYNGCTNISSAEVLSNYLRKKHGDRCPKIIVHRDRDYLTDIDVQKEQDKYQRKGISLFFTKGTDIESYFVNIEHILSCNEFAKRENIKKILNEAKEEESQTAINLLREKEYGNKHKDKSSHTSGYLDEIYQKNEDRFFHGKKVLKKVRIKFQSTYKNNLKIKLVSNYLQDQELLSFSK